MATTEAPPTAKRTFSRLVDSEVVEDYSLRYAPSTFRRWSEYTVATAALGGIAYLADFAIGGSIAISFGFTNALIAILLAASVIFLTSIPIAYYSAKYSIDMDLLTRGAGFGYLGSTITSIIYASFTFIFFSLEGSIMAQAFNSSMGIPLWLSYLLGALIIIPLVTFGMTLLAKLQVWTQPLWMLMMFSPFLAILIDDPSAYTHWTGFIGTGHTSGFNAVSMGLGAGIALSLIAQIGEQCDYLRFMPAKTPANARKWWTAVMLAGPGWVILGAFKQLGGAFLAYYIFTKVGKTLADQPIHMYEAGYNVFLPSWLVVTAATFFVVLSQIKINVTNAYSGSLSWSNFFSRILHWHPGRAIWVLFNVGIALTLMEVGVFSFLNTVLGFYSNVAIAWIGAIVADLVINKPILKLSPSYIEFKRAHLYTINPVGFGSMLIASIVSILAFYKVGPFNTTWSAYSPFLALTIAMVLSPALAYITKGKYYIAREDTLGTNPQATDLHTCISCGQDWESPDMAICPFHKGAICSLCCTLEKTCHDMCKKSGVDSAMPAATLPMVS